MTTSKYYQSSLIITREQDKMMRFIADSKGISRAAAIREAIDRYIRITKIGRGMNYEFAEKKKICDCVNKGMA
tara:strand:+ start:6434 stop:6652 length:219 start_codon:yes stop_codon:yes gene_type:complete